MLPKKEKALQNDYDDCERRKKFIEADKSSYKDYFDEALSDMASAQEDMNSEELKWALVKIYQSLFLMCNALLVKNLGFYSKDHMCLLTALMRHDIISKKTKDRLNELINENLYEEINSVRLERNQVLYFPKTQLRLSKDDIIKTFENAKKLIRVLGDEL